MMRGDDKDALEDSWGVAPPYGAYRGHYGDYTLAQIGSIGSGRLGGWSAVALGGSFDEAGPELRRPALPDLDAQEEAETEPLSVPGEEPELIVRRR